MFPCKSCGCGITSGTTKCPSCEENPFAIPQSFSKNEWNGRKVFRSKKNETRSLESLINSEKII